MSEPAALCSPEDLQPPVTGDTEEVDAVVVDSTADVVPAVRDARAVVPAVQAAAVAATGFVAGAAAAGLVRRRRRSRDLARAGSRRRIGVRGQRGSGTGGELVQIVGSRSLLVDVHLLGGESLSESSSAGRAAPGGASPRPFPLPARREAWTVCCAAAGGARTFAARRRGAGRGAHRAERPRTVCCSVRARAERAAAEYGIARMRFALGVDEDLGPFRGASRAIRYIGRSLRRRPWLRVWRRPEPFEALAWAVCEQLIEYERAAAIERRVVSRLGRRWAGGEGLGGWPARRAHAGGAGGRGSGAAAVAAIWRARARCRSCAPRAKSPAGVSTCAAPSTSAVGAGCARSQASGLGLWRCSRYTDRAVTTRFPRATWGC